MPAPGDVPLPTPGSFDVDMAARYHRCWIASRLGRGLGVPGSQPSPHAPAQASPDKHRVALVAEMFSQPGFQSLGFGASLDRVVSPIEPPFQPEPQPLAP